MGGWCAVQLPKDLVPLTNNTFLAGALWYKLSEEWTLLVGQDKMHNKYWFWSGCFFSMEWFWQHVESVFPEGEDVSFWPIDMSHVTCFTLWVRNIKIFSWKRKSQALRWLLSCVLRLCRCNKQSMIQQGGSVCHWGWIHRKCSLHFC